MDTGLQNTQMGGAGLSGGIDLPQKTGQRQPGDRRVNGHVPGNLSVYQSQVGFFDGRGGQPGMDMGVFGKQNDAKGVPIQPGQRMKGAALPLRLVVAKYIIG